jgi:hypothetical protein
MELLTAYVRQHAPRRPEETQQVEEDTAVEKKSEEDSRGKSEAERVLKGEVNRGTAAVVTQIWNGARSCVVASARMRELEEIEERLRALEEDLPSGLS